ncbi:MAG: alanine racemase [Gemmatimonadaceae bacterium]
MKRRSSSHLTPLTGVDISPAPRQIADLETPATLVDLGRLSENLDRMASYAALHALALRPHVKTHKSPRIAADQIRLGAIGLTCATPRELEVMSEVADDLLFAYPPVGRLRLARLMDLPVNVHLTVAVDSPPSILALAAAARDADREVGVYVEMDVGMRRVGVSLAEEVVALATLVRDNPPLVFRGLTCYPGHVRQPLAEQGPSLRQLSRQLRTAIDALERVHLRPGIVSGGSTPAALRIHEVPEITEVRPGTYAYNDRTQTALGACTADDCALTVLATVISTAVRGQAVVDAGSKALGRESATGADGEGWGAVLGRPEARIVRMSEEHGILDLSGTEWRPSVGDQVRIVPNHACVVVHLNDVVHGVRRDVVETSWPVSARGRERA